ncbi:mitogen-activated protein kinase kinase kinase 5-like isoform X2 [Anneissia japonica]|uniref:mitogen-activated protein kinase kinase kinase 5-like isoform X2 n=1 Tax=Anneissia japonica TaxID=1529436 RepID=UPI0014258076|nr:mitogen-activated protein kinase kinase kinase 5-like isoform X2 [Anneissia japonica]
MMMTTRTRYQLRLQLQPVNQHEKDDIATGSKKKETWRHKLKKNPQKYEFQKLSDKLYSMNYRKNMSEEKKADYREKTRLRMQKYRERKKASKENQGKTEIKKKKGKLPKTGSTQKATDESRREKERLKKRALRERPGYKERENELRREKRRNVRLEKKRKEREEEEGRREKEQERLKSTGSTQKATDESRREKERLKKRALRERPGYKERENELRREKRRNVRLEKKRKEREEEEGRREKDEQERLKQSITEPSRTTMNAKQEHGEESSNSVSYLQVDNTVSFKKRQRNPSDSGADDTDNTLWLNRQTHLSQSATKHTRITPLSKPPLMSASTVGKRKMSQVPEVSLGHSWTKSELQKPSETVSNISPPGIGSLPYHSDARKAKSSTVALATTPDSNPAPPSTHAALVISPPLVSSITSTIVAPALAPAPFITPAPVISPHPVVIAAPVPAPAVVPAPVVQSTPQPQITQPPMQANQSKNMIYVNDKQYIILKLVGKGGSSKVYQVYSTDVKNVLAIKRVDLELVDDLTKQGYINEITLLTRLQKKTEKIIKLYDFQITDSLIVMVMECGSIDLSTFLRRNKNIREDKIRFYWHEMLEAVHVIHQEGIIHSDLKPANFLFVEGTLKLIDFGIANAIQVDQTSIFKDQQIGTFNYMSPEAIRETSPSPAMDSSGRSKPRLKINFQSDVWSLGCILYYMVYGKTPFQHITNALMKLHAIIDPSHEINFPAISNKDLHDVLQKCLIRNPKKRPSIETLLKHPFLRNKTQDKLASSTNSGTCDISASQLQALISQLSSVRVHSPKSLSAISKAKGLIEQLTKKSGISDTPAELEQAISGSHPASLTVIETAPSMSAGVFPLSQPPMKQAKMAARQPLQSVNMVDVQKVQTNLKSGTSASSAGLKQRYEINDKENLGMRESMVNSQ